MEGEQIRLPAVARWMLSPRMKEQWNPPWIGEGEEHGRGRRRRSSPKLQPATGADARRCFTPMGDGLHFCSRVSPSVLQVRWVEVWTSARATLAHTKGDRGVSDSLWSKQGVKPVL